MANEKRLIDANAWLRETYFQEGIYPHEMLKKEIEEQPTVDAVEVVHGRWIDNTDERGFLCNAWRKCSVCGGLNYSKRPPYCPNCGAKMDGGNYEG